MLGSYVDLGNPVSDHPLNQGLEVWVLGLPGRFGHSIFELCKGRKGTGTNGVNVGQAPNGFGALKYVNASAQRHSIPYDARMDITGVDFCTTGWFWHAASSSKINGLWGRPNGGNGDCFGVTSNTNGISMTVWNATDGFKSAKKLISTALGVWYWFYGEWDNTGKLVGADINDSGTLTTTSVPNGVTNRTDTAFVVSHNESGFDWADGYLADIRYYRNRRLTAAERSELYEQTKRGHPDTLRRWSRKAWLFGQPATAATRANFLTLLDVA